MDEGVFRQFLCTKNTCLCGGFQNGPSQPNKKGAHRSYLTALLRALSALSFECIMGVITKKEVFKLSACCQDVGLNSSGILLVVMGESIGDAEVLKSCF